jgi:type IV pilus assembly protein PilV
MKLLITQSLRCAPIQYGNTMIEIMISLIVLSLGSLSAAGLQIVSKNLNHEAQQNLVASFVANDIIEKMRNNPGSLANYGGTINGSVSTTEPAPVCSAAAPCTISQMATHDLWLWQQMLNGASVQIGGANATRLVQATGCITNNAGQVQVTIAWFGSMQTADANVVAGCGTAGVNRRQLVINTFI